ncbi:hypothetical protein ACHAXN_006895 [Cyclotella atomus]
MSRSERRAYGPKRRMRLLTVCTSKLGISGA